MPVVGDSTAYRQGSGYPAPYDGPCKDRHVEMLSDAGGLTQFGVVRVTLAPGAWSSQRHWHSAEDEFVYILQGSPTLIDDDGETALNPGNATTHKAGDPNGHHMVNRTDEDVVFLAVGTRRPDIDSCHYPDVDMHLPANGQLFRTFVHKDGSGFDD